MNTIIVRYKAMPHRAAENIADVVVLDIVKMPVSGRDYPRTWDQFLDWFPDDDACIEYLEDLRSPPPMP